MYKRLTQNTIGLFTGLVEVWKPIRNYEDSYEISSFGRVKSLARLRLSKGGVLAPLRERIMKLKTNKCGYSCIGLHSQGKKFFTVHRLVAEHFSSNPENKPTVNHIDSNKQNNNIRNLEWSTHVEQMQHARENDLLEVRGSPKFSKQFKQEVLDYYSQNEISIKKLSDLFQISERTAGRIVNFGVKPRTTTRVLKSGDTIIENILTKSDVAEIKRLRAEGMTLAAIGLKFNRGTSQIHRVVHDKTRTTDIE